MVRKEPFFKGDLVHVYNRGNRNQLIVKDNIDRWRFLQALYYFNHSLSILNTFRTLKEALGVDFSNKLIWVDGIGKRDPLVKIHAFILLDNHYHFILEEIRDGGVTEFMRKIGTSVTSRFNKRYNETGRLFQGAYKARRINKDDYLQYLMVYIHIKNVFDLYPGGFENALKNFGDAFEFALEYPYSSLGAYFSNSHISSPIITTDMCSNIFTSKEDFKGFAKNCIEFVHFDEKRTTILSV